MRIRVIGWSLLAVGMVFLSIPSFAQVGAPTIAPPELPAYEQPMCPGDGYIWTPGYWAWDGEYYWVPGTWVMAPETGYLWTPGFWGWGGAGFVFNEGYWGLSVGFYGGIDYGFGYFGHGYEGGRWENGHFFYNTAVNRVDVNAIHNVYNARVDERVNRVSYNGGNGGIDARATSEEEAAARGRRSGPVSAQTQHAWSAHNNPQQHVSANHGAPPATATARANLAVHPKDLPPVERPAAQDGKREAGPEIPEGAEQYNREADPGSAETPAEAGPGTSAVDQTEGCSRENAAGRTTTPATDAANASRAHAADAADAAETVGWRRRSAQRRAPVIVSRAGVAEG